MGEGLKALLAMVGPHATVPCRERPLGHPKWPETAPAPTHNPQAPQGL